MRMEQRSVAENGSGRSPVRGRRSAPRDVLAALHAKLICERGQGTTEYAILVGV